MNQHPNCCVRGGSGPCPSAIITPPPLRADMAHEISTQRRMIASLKRLGPQHPARVAGKPSTLGELFDHYSRALLCVQEVMDRCA